MCRLSKVAHLITLNKMAKDKAEFPLQFIEHGVPTHFRPAPSRIFRQYHVASFGFWDEEKRHDQLCEVAEDAGVAIDLYSQPPSEFGLAGCEGLVTYYREFLDTPKLITRLSQYSALVFLRRPAHEVFAVSGSARMALTANVPVICEDSMHFEDLAEAVDLVPFNKIPQRIQEVVRNQTLRDIIVARQMAFVSRWSEQETQRMHFHLYQTLRAKKIEKEETEKLTEIESDKSSKEFAERKNVFASSALDHFVDEADDVASGLQWHKRGTIFREEL